jgi:5,10-methenyltetrahydrofolate synthetase
MIKDRIRKDLARRLVYCQSKELEDKIAAASGILPELQRLIATLQEQDPSLGHVSGYRSLSDEIQLSIDVDYIVTTDYADAVKNVKGIVVVPLFGFNSTNHRLGRGGGFYDKLLQATRPIAIGIGTESRRVEFVPEPHDQPMDYIITEKGVHKHA